MSTPFLFVVSSPSGGGKSTLCRALTAREPRLYYSISCTTRPPRPAEVDGRDYVFLSTHAFEEKIAQGEFLEWARVHDNYYGTPKAPAMAAMNEGRDVILDLDPQGALALKEANPGTVCVYVCPPSWQLLEERLRGRGQDRDEVIAKRLANARRELSFLDRYDYAVVNDDLNAAVEELFAILRAEHRRLSRVGEELKKLALIQQGT